MEKIDGNVFKTVCSMSPEKLEKAREAILKNSRIIETEWGDIHIIRHSAFDSLESLKGIVCWDEMRPLKINEE